MGLDKELARGGAELTIELLHHLVSENTNKNIVFSPLSVQICVGLAFSGASGDTAAEIAKGMRFSSDSHKDVAKNFHSILNKYSKNNLLKIANKAYVMQGSSVKEEFKTVLWKFYNAEIEATDFNNSATAAERINKWVEEQTAGKIQQLIPDNCLSSDTRLLLLNAIHFKGIWKKKFKVDSTTEDDFWTSSTQSTKCNFMNTKGKFTYGYLEHLNCTALQMPYKDSDLSMLILLPNEVEGWKMLIENLKSVNLLDILKEMETSEINVRLPKFKNDFSVELNSILQKLGICKMFEMDADFRNMLESNEPIHVSNVLHKACIEVNEEGTEAAAATGVIITARSASFSQSFDADHPFFYVIWNGTNILYAGLFMGDL